MIVGVVAVVAIGAGVASFSDIIMVVAVPHNLADQTQQEDTRKSKFMKMCK